MHDADFLREAVAVLCQALMELKVSRKVGADRYQRTDQRSTYRNGYRTREWETRVGTVNLRIPKLREGSYFPSLLEPRRRAEKALVAVVQEAYVHGVSTRKVDELVQALGLGGASARARFLASVRNWTSISRRFATGRLKDVTRMCGSTPSTSRCGKAVG